MDGPERWLAVHSNWRTGWSVIILLSLAASAPAWSASPDLDRFRFYNNCEPVGVLVETLPEAADDLELTHKKIRDLVEVRLRSARLYKGPRDTLGPYLYVRINVLEPRPGLKSSSFNVEVSFAKVVEDTVTGYRTTAATWTDGALGYGDGDFIRSAVSDELDKFILSYLRVNERACDPAPHRTQ